MKHWFRILNSNFSFVFVFKKNLKQLSFKKANVVFTIMKSFEPIHLQPTEVRVYCKKVDSAHKQRSSEFIRIKGKSKKVFKIAWKTRMENSREVKIIKSMDSKHAAKT